MGTVAVDNSRMNKLVYLLSLVFFMLASVKSFLGFAMLIMGVFAVFIRKLKFRELKAIDKDTHLFAALIVVTLFVIDTNANRIMTLLLSLLSYYFIVQSICFVRDIFAISKVNFKGVNTQSNLTRMETILIVITSIFAMVWFTTSSPVYKINYWGDAQMYFTFGKSINNGMVLYKDIFDHKGPYIYFIHSIAAFISPTSFIGVFFLEIIAAIVFTVFVWKTVKLFYTPKHSLILIPLQVFVSYNTYSFWYGDSAEEMCIPLLAIVVYIAVKSELNSRLPSFKETMVIGAISGYLFLFKFNFCALIIGYLFYVVVISIIRKTGRELGLDVLAYLCGVLISVIPVVIYLSVNNAWADFFEVYFYENMVLYPTLIDAKVHIVYVTLSNIHYAMFNNPKIAALLSLSLFTMAALKKELKGLFLSMFVMESIIVFFVRLYIFYYSFILLSIAIIGWLLVCVIVDYTCDAVKHLGKLYSVVPHIILVLIAVTAFMSCDNLYYLSQEESDIPQLEFAKVINETENPKILTYDIMDDGFYTYADVIPNCKYPVYTNMSRIIPEHRKVKEEMIANCEFDYIIAYEGDYDWDNYEVVAFQKGYYYSHALDEGWVSIQTPYYLYKCVK